MNRKLSSLAVLAVAAMLVGRGVGQETPPELDKLRELEAAYEKLRESLSRDFQAREKKATEAVTKAREEWLKAVRKRDKEAEKTARETLNDAEKELRRARSLRLELGKSRLLRFSPAPRPRKAEEELGLRLGRPTAVLASQLGLEKNKGLIVERVDPDSSAAKAGLKIHDVLLEFAGKEVSADLLALRKILGEAKPGISVSLKVMRQGKEHSIRSLELPVDAPKVIRR